MIAHSFLNSATPYFLPLPSSLFLLGAVGVGSSSLLPDPLFPVP
ncbi:hypothetical protein [Moorena producens]